mmetsp:Transcript_20743/g.69574  ORF Transcript_20743/g.69574 Transcript_20743/m.69574 type:complete len:261 (+) Transcript_20743:283-1065(+)
MAARRVADPEQSPSQSGRARARGPYGGVSGRQGPAEAPRAPPVRGQKGAEARSRQPAGGGIVAVGRRAEEGRARSQPAFSRGRQGGKRRQVTDGRHRRRVGRPERRAHGVRHGHGGHGRRGQHGRRLGYSGHGWGLQRDGLQDRHCAAARLWRPVRAAAVHDEGQHRGVHHVHDVHEEHAVRAGHEEVVQGRHEGKEAPARALHCPELVEEFVGEAPEVGGVETRALAAQERHGEQVARVVEEEERRVVQRDPGGHPHIN